MSFGRAFRLVAIGLGVVALVLAVVCVVEVVRTRTFLAGSEVASGQVVELIARESCRDRDPGRDGAGDREVCSTVYAPRIVFTTSDGREVDVTSDTAEAPPAYAERDVVEIRYDPARPAQARVDSVTGVWFGAIVTGSIAAAFAAMCSLWIVLAVKFRRV